MQRTGSLDPGPVGEQVRRIVPVQLAAPNNGRCDLATGW